MAFANPSISDITATTIENRSRKIADNVTKNNALLYLLQERGRVRTVDGGAYIMEELSQAENSNAMFYNGYDVIATAAQDVLTAAQFSLKQAAVAITYSGLEILQNSGREKQIDLVDARVSVGESSMENLIAQGLYSDGTGFGGKQITGLQSAVVLNPTTGTYGGIDSSTTVGAFWRNQTSGSLGAQTVTTIIPNFNTLWAKCVRGADHPDLIVLDNALWGLFTGSQQTLQRFGDGKLAQVGFTSLKFMQADVVLDGGVGGFCPANTGYFLNTKYLSFRPHKDRNMAPLLGGKNRSPINQDAEITLMGWAGNLTCSNRSLQGFFAGY